mgnify:CR=1 FL=1
MLELRKVHIGASRAHVLQEGVLVGAQLQAQRCLALAVGHVLDACGQFKLWTVIAQKQLTDAQLGALLIKGAVAVKGLTSSKGSKFDATLKLDKTGKVAFEFS